MELFALHKKSVSSVSVLAQRLGTPICQVADYLHEARNFLEFRTSEIAHACICTAFSIGIFPWWLFTVEKHPKKSYIGVNIHGQRNRSSRPGDCQTNVCSTVPERWQKRTYEVPKSGQDSRLAQFQATAHMTPLFFTTWKSHSTQCKDCIVV